jgi:CheY-like chemotaxis protein
MTGRFAGRQHCLRQEPNSLLCDPMKLNEKIIFLIEDNPDIIDVYKMAMKSADINMEVFSWGGQAIERIKQIQNGKKEKPRIVLLDLILPDINGIEILKEIKGSEKTKDIIVFVLSNYTNEGFLPENGIKPDKFILKTGITPTELVKLVKEYLK